MTALPEKRKYGTSASSYPLSLRHVDGIAGLHAKKGPPPLGSVTVAIWGHNGNGHVSPKPLESSDFISRSVDNPCVVYERKPSSYNVVSSWRSAIIVCSWSF